MKKIFSLLLAAVLILSLAACSKSSGEDKDPVIGTWKAVSAEYNGEAVEVPEITNDVKEDGTFVYNFSGNEFNGTWTNDNGTYTFTVDNMPVTGKIEGGQLFMSEDAQTIIFEK